MRQAFREFLLLPTCIITGFLVLAALTYALDQSRAEWLEPVRGMLAAYAMFAGTQQAHRQKREVQGSLEFGLQTGQRIGVQGLFGQHCTERDSPTGIIAG